MEHSNSKLKTKKIKTFLVLISICSIPSQNLISEEYSIRKKKPQKKQESVKKGTEPLNQIGFSRENNKISNQFWLEEGALFTPESLDISSSVTTQETTAQPKESEITIPI